VSGFVYHGVFRRIRELVDVGVGIVFNSADDVLGRVSLFTVVFANADYACAVGDSLRLMSLCLPTALSYIIFERDNLPIDDWVVLSLRDATDDGWLDGVRVDVLHVASGVIAPAGVEDACVQIARWYC
jgi:hypothetical protein